MGSINIGEAGDVGHHNDSRVPVAGYVNAASHATKIRAPANVEVVLLSWFLVLLRVREDATSFYWAPAGDADGQSWTNTNILSLEELTDNMGQTIEQALELVARKANVYLEKANAIVLSSSRSGSHTNDEESVRLRVCLREQNMPVEVVWQSLCMLEFTISSYCTALADSIKLCADQPTMTIRDCLHPSYHDLNAIWKWNATNPPTYAYSMHEIFSKQAVKSPSKIAINSWDGDLSYEQIETYSTNLAFILIARGVVADDVVPICSEKSKWATVSVLAVMKTCATFVLMDPTLPLARLQNMATQVGGKIMLCTEQQRELANDIIAASKPVIVNQQSVETHHSSDSPQLPEVSPSTIMYIIFTSGSTGTPKGVKISHETYSSSAVPRAATVGYAEHSRVLDFASYAFDVSIDSMLLTLCNGGCLCIPSDEDRLNDINRVMREMRINYPGLTPSVARILDHDVISSLDMLGLGGEAVSARDVNIWGKDTRIVIGYGPCECTIGCTVNGDAAAGRSYISIGKGNGANIWIVDPNDHELLLPFGAVGELLVEGPIVGQGYLDDPEKTASVFIESPSWLLAGHEHHNGRTGRLYKTGDLGRYDPDGSGGIVFVGRKDTQVKLRGQRVELGEIESRLKEQLPENMDVVAEVITPAGASNQQILVTFVSPILPKRDNSAEVVVRELNSEQRNVLKTAEEAILKVLPRYMVPSTFIPINQIPVLISGKTDRKRLREFGATIDLQAIEPIETGIASLDLNEQQLRLRQCWADVLKIEAENIKDSDNFFALGGDSLLAMKLVSIARNVGLLISVRNTFDSPTLKEMCEIVQSLNKSCDSATLQPFALMSTNVEQLCEEAAKACSVPPSAIEDIYPCSATQESLFTFSLKASKPYTAQRTACIPASIDIEIWKDAWSELAASLPILRTRVAHLHNNSLSQVVIDEDISWRSSDTLSEYLEMDKAERMELGDRLARYAVIQDQSDKKWYMVWTIHHVVYDGWSEPLILQQLQKLLDGGRSDVTTRMKDFIHYLKSANAAELQSFWRDELNGATGPQYPPLPSRDYFASSHDFMEREFKLQPDSKLPFTLATIIRGAWALVASQHINSNDVVFGETLTGRDIALPGVEDISGPLIATVPVRIQIDRIQSVELYLRGVQQSMLNRIQFQHMGMQNIRKVSKDAQFACETGTGIVIQPETDDVATRLGFARGDPVREALHFNPYPLMLAFGLRKDGFRVCANFDQQLITSQEMDRLLDQLQVVASQFCEMNPQPIGQISIVSGTELERIWSFNAQASEVLQDFTSQTAREILAFNYDEKPRRAIPWVCNQSDGSMLTPIGCVGSLWLEDLSEPVGPVHSPSWLVAGSPHHRGRQSTMKATGNVVRLLESGKLVFVHREENTSMIEGHSLDLADLESRMSQAISRRFEVIAAVVSKKATASKLVTFIYDSGSIQESRALFPAPIKLPIMDQSTMAALSIAHVVSIELLQCLRKLDKFMKDSCPSYMIPSAYIPMNKVFKIVNEFDRQSWNDAAARIESTTLDHISVTLPQLWSSVAPEVTLTKSERIIVAAWSKILCLEETEIEVEDNFFRKGGDSVLAMKLAADLRSKGYSLTVADIFKNMRLQDAAKVMRTFNEHVQDAIYYKPFSTLDAQQLELYSSGAVSALLRDPAQTIHDVYPTTASQRLDIQATITTPRTSFQFTMLFFSSEIEADRLVDAVCTLTKKHDILRTVFVRIENVMLQIVTNNTVIPITRLETTKDLRECVAQLCDKEIEQEFLLGDRFIKIYHVMASDGSHCLVIGLSHALYDGVSLPRLLQDLEVLYTGHEIEEYEPFSHYVAQSMRQELQDQAISYWSKVLQGSQMTVIPRSSEGSLDKSIFRERAISSCQKPGDITMATLLTTSWAVLLSRRLHVRDVLFGSISSGRNLDKSYHGNIMGPCYQFTPVRIQLSDDWTAEHLLRQVQKQMSESAAHDFLGFEKIASHCSRWSKDVRFFDSVVHYQDTDDIDIMPFAGTEVGVDSSNPHGDAAYPLKAVSFVRKGRLHVGVVASCKDEDLVDEVLNQLVSIVTNLR